MTRLCLHLNFVSMLVLLVNVFLAIALDLKYFTWKTNKKAVKIALVEWMVCVTATVLLPWFDSSIDLQEASVYRYRRTILIKSRYGLIAILSGFTFVTVAIGVLIYFSIQRKKRQVRSQV